MTQATGALTGIRIIESAQGIAGPYAAMLLAEQGADVIKIEPPAGDRTRGLPGFRVWNRSKRSTVFDIASATGRDRLRSLCAGADVLITDGSGDAALFETVATANPALIHCWMPPYGGHGEAVGALANDDLIAARGALMASQWAHREGPVFLTLPVASYGTAMLAAGAVCAALIARAETSRGQRIEVSWLAGALAMQTGSVVDHPALQRVMTLVRDPQGVIPVYRLFKASDGWLFLACGNPTFFNKLCLVFERPELVSDPRFDGAPWAISPAHWAEIKALIQSIVETRPRGEWLRLLGEADIPCAPVLTRFDFVDDPQVRQLGFCTEIDDLELGPMTQVGLPVNLRATPGAIQCAAPRLSDATMSIDWRASAAAVRPTATPRSATGGPLSGTLVLDFTNYIAGPSAAMQLALAGADVIKIEPPGGDPFRAFGFGFFGWNQGKRGLALDLSKPEARAIVRDLVCRADVIVENLRPGATRRLGVDYESAAGLNPRLVYGSITAFGSTGPRGQEVGFDPLLQARSGIMAAQGGHDHDPVFLACAVCDYAVGLLCAFGVMAALYARERSGRGQLVETSLAQAALAVQSGEYVFYKGRPDLEQGGPDLIGRHPLRRAYRCSDGWIFVSAEAAQWRALRAALIPACRAEDPIAEPADGEVGAQLAAAFASRTRDEVLQQLASLTVPAAPVLSVPDLFRDPQIAANDLLHTAHVEHWGEFRQTGILVKYAATPVTIPRAAPQLGEHTDEILHSVLGYTSERIAAVRASGALA